MDVPTPTLVPSLSTFSMHLTHLIPSLPTVQAHGVYRAIAHNLSNAIIERAVFAGGAHRFSVKGAQQFASDYHHGWIAVVHDIASNASALGSRPQAPWRYLADAAILLSLPLGNEGSADQTEITFDQACFAVFQQDPAAWTSIQRSLGIDDRMALRVGREILRRRIDCSW